MEKYRSRNYCLVLYPDDPTHVEAMAKLESGYKYIAILHDRDTWTEDDTEDTTLIGTPKKPHWHVVIKFPQARWDTSVANDLGIARNYLQKCVSYESSVLYLVHFGLPHKFQYTIEDVFGTLIDDLRKAMDSSDEDERVLQLLDMIDNSGFLSMTDLIRKACKDHKYGELRRMGYLVGYILREHNEQFENPPPSEDTRGFEDFQRWTGTKGLDGIKPI